MSPLLDFDLGHMFDGDPQAVPAPDSRVHDTEPPLPQHWTNLDGRVRFGYLLWLRIFIFN